MTASERLLETPRWTAVEAYFSGSIAHGEPCNPRDPAISADGRRVACTVTIRTDLGASERTAVWVADRDDPDRATLVDDHHDVRRPRFAPDGGLLAVIVGADVGIVAGGSLRRLPSMAGFVEDVAWSPDGSRLLAVVADPDADVAGAQGSGRLSSDGPDWFPHVMADEPMGGWRRVYVIGVDGHGDTVDEWAVVSAQNTTVWEADWCGPDRIVTVQSTRPDEAAWFAAEVGLLSVGASSGSWVGFRPDAGRCVGLPAGRPGGAGIAVVTATCSDRTVVAGAVTVIDVATGQADELDVGFDVTGMAWRGDDVLVAVGQRGLDTVIVEVTVAARRVVEAWSSSESTCGQRYPEIAVSTTGPCALVVEGYHVAPALAVLERDRQGPEPVTRFGPVESLDTVGRATAVRWSSSDGLEIEGLVATPDGSGPFPLVTYVHGGPIWAWRSRWSMGYPSTHLLVAAGFAVFHPNPRGSAGRGEEFRTMVIGDLGGAESDDILSGLDHLVDAGVADADRLGVLGGSHGGFMAARLATISGRFAAVVSYCPVTHWPSMRLTTNDIAAQDRLIGAGAPSPLEAVDRVTAPTLVLTGSRDLITPASQGLMFHRALALRGVATQYVEYPNEGHGVRTFPAQIDFSVRVLDWFEQWMGPDAP